MMFLPLGLGLFLLRSTVLPIGGILQLSPPGAISNERRQISTYHRHILQLYQLC